MPPPDPSNPSPAAEPPSRRGSEPPSRRAARAVVGLPRRTLVMLVRGYQRFISPGLPPSCRFYPSCSQYALEALQRHGALIGTWLAMRRLVRCHPFNPGGDDPVPERWP